MRILYFITSDISARFLRGQLAFLIDAGHEVHVGTRLSQPPATFDAGVVAHDLAFEREPSLRADVQGLMAAVRLVRHLRPDAVNASTPKAGLLGMVAAKLCRVPRRVYVVRGLRFETLTGVRRLVFRALERLATSCATDVVYNSRSLRTVAERERTVRRGRGVILGGGSGNGIDIARFDHLPTSADARRRIGVPQDARAVGFVGRLTRDKGIVDLVQAWDEIEPPCVLVIVGDFEDGDPVPDSIRRRIETDERIVRVPWTDDTIGCYRALDVLAFPSYREGLPNVPLEAQLCGVPVVAYAATGTVDAVMSEPPNVLVDVGDVQGLARALTWRLVERRRSTAAREWVANRFRREDLWRALEGIYH